MQILYFLPNFGRKIIELDIDSIEGILPVKSKAKKDKELYDKMTNAKNMMKNLKDLFIEMTLSNRKYANPAALITSIVDQKGSHIHVGDEEDVGEIGARMMSSLQEAYSYYEESDQSDSSEGEEDDNDTGYEESDQEEKKTKSNTRMSTRSMKIEAKRMSYGPKAFGKELYKDPQDHTRGFINQMFFGKKIEVTE
jgi:hypothetical protein